MVEELEKERKFNYRANNSGHKSARVVALAHYILPNYYIYPYKIHKKYLKGLWHYGLNENSLNN